MTHLILIRHGESSWNPLGIYQGQTDTPLSDRGRRQMAATASHMREIAIGAQATYTSPLRRAAESARIIARQLGTPVFQDPRLQEIHHGEWQGLQIDEVQRRWSRLWKEWRTNPNQVQMPGGEHFCDVQHRVIEAVCDITRSWPSSTVIIVSHDIPLRIIIATAAPFNEVYLHKLSLENGALTVVEWRDHRRRLITLNERGHLRKTGSSLANQAI